MNGRFLGVPVILPAALSFFFVVSCATATEFEVEPGKGGVIATNPPRDPEAKKKARALMQENCGAKKAVILKEGFVKVGESTASDSSTAPEKQTSTNLFTGKSSSKTVSKTSGSATTTEVREWRITYKCQ